MSLKELESKLVAVLGFGVEGKATAAYLIKHGIKPVLFDDKPWDKWSEIEKLEIKKLGVNFIFGPDSLNELKGFDVAFRSPGVKLSQVTHSAGSGQASDKLQVTSQTKWFFDNCPAKIIGVTGTKGKGTTASLIYEILSVAAATGRHQWRPMASATEATPKIHLTGNIGKIQPLEILDELTPDDWVVYELSSFQLQDLTQSPHIGVVLMVTSEHLDYHETIQEYREAKQSIVKFQSTDDIAIINADFEASMEIGKLGDGKKLFFSRKRELEAGCFIRGDQIVIAGDGISNFQFSIFNLQLRGAHNLENVCAAVLAGLSAGCKEQAISKVLSEFKGLEHRLEFVAEKNGVKYYNDSFSTTPETAIAAIKSFTEPEIVILGGSSKNSDFSELGKTITTSKNIKSIILIGQESQRIYEAIREQGKVDEKILQGATDMPEIFAQIESVASRGDVVLLSPACASFGMFKNYQQRGLAFKDQVSKLIG